MNLLRGEGPLLRIGHRGAAALAPENTLEGFGRALEAGVDLIEFDVVEAGGGFAVAHDPALAAGAPTLAEALAWFAERPHVGLHVDLKLKRREGEVAAALAAAGLAPRAVVSTPRAHGLLEVARAVPDLGLGFTYPEDRHGVSGRRALVPLVLAGVVALRAILPRRVGRLVRRAGATALMLHHRIVTAAAVERAHRHGVAVVAWTVDDPRELARLDAAGVDAVVTNDPRIFGSPSLH